MRNYDFVPMKVPKKFRDKMKVESAQKGISMADYARLLADEGNSLEEQLNNKQKKGKDEVSKKFKIGF